MNMLMLQGTLINVYESPKGISKETGEAFGGQHRIQITGDNMLKNGSKRVELVDLIVDDITPYRDAIGKPVSVPVGVYVHSGKPAFYSVKEQGKKA